MAIAVIVGLLLTVRVAPNRRAGALVLLPAMAGDARFGLAALPLLAYAAVAANLLRGVRGPRVISTRPTWFSPLRWRTWVRRWCPSSQVG